VSRRRRRSGKRTLLQRLLDQSGVAVLVEVMVASLILMLAIVPVFAALTASLLSLEHSVATTMATNLLQDRAEALKAAGYHYVIVDPENPVVTLENYEGRPFDILQEVTYVEGMVDENEISQVKKVILTIYRHPVSPDDQPLGKWEFLLYADGI